MKCLSGKTLQRFDKPFPVDRLQSALLRRYRNLEQVQALTMSCAYYYAQPYLDWIVKLLHDGSDITNTSWSIALILLDNHWIAIAKDMNGLAIVDSLDSRCKFIQIKDNLYAQCASQLAALLHSKQGRDVRCPYKQNRPLVNDVWLLATDSKGIYNYSMDAPEMQQQYDTLSCLFYALINTLGKTIPQLYNTFMEHDHINHDALADYRRRFGDDDQLMIPMDLPLVHWLMKMHPSLRCAQLRFVESCVLKLFEYEQPCAIIMPQPPCASQPHNQRHAQKLKLYRQKLRAFIETHRNHLKIDYPFDSSMAALTNKRSSYIHARKQKVNGLLLSDIFFCTTNNKWHPLLLFANNDAKTQHYRIQDLLYDIMAKRFPLRLIPVEQENLTSE